MITDQLCVFTDNAAVKANGNSNAIAIMPFIGKGEPVLVSVAVTEAYPAAATLNIAVQESNDNATFASVGAIDVPKAKLTRIGAFSFALPATLRGKYVRLAYTVGGTPATGKLWTGITRDALEPYESGQYIRAGKKVQ